MLDFSITAHFDMYDVMSLLMSYTLRFVYGLLLDASSGRSEVGWVIDCTPLDPALLSLKSLQLLPIRVSYFLLPEGRSQRGRFLLLNTSCLWLTFPQHTQKLLRFLLGRSRLDAPKNFRWWVRDRDVKLLFSLAAPHPDSDASKEKMRS